MKVDEAKEYYGFKIASDDWSKRKLTKERAMAIIELFKSQLERDCEWEKAFRMALKSLEAWEKVREIFKAKSTSDDWECIHDLQIWEDALEIIDKHLKEVSE